MVEIADFGYFGHQATCPEVPLACPNKCGFKDIKRKDMDNHRSKCPQEPVECPFAEAGCTGGAICRSQLEDHMTSSLQQHLMLVMKDSKETKRELAKTKEKLDDTEVKLHETEQRQNEAIAELSVAMSHIFMSNSLVKNGDSVTFRMPNFSYYRCSGKVWHSPPFYYREGYKMCLAVYANGVGEGAGTHVSLSLFLLRGEYDDKLEFPAIFSKSWLHTFHSLIEFKSDGILLRLLRVHLCDALKCPTKNEFEIRQECKFCPLKNDALKLVDNCLILKISSYNECWIKIEIV